MKSLLTTVEKVRTREFQAITLRTNLELLTEVSDYQEMSRKDGFLTKAILDILAGVEMHDLQIGKLSVVRQGTKVNIWAEAKKRIRFPGPDGILTQRLSETLRCKPCDACGHYFYDGAQFDPEAHAKGCKAIQVWEVMTT